MGATIMGGTFKGRHYSTMLDDYDLMCKRNDNNKPFFYARGGFDDGEEGKRNESAHLVFTAANMVLVYAAPFTQKNPFGPFAGSAQEQVSVACEPKDGPARMFLYHLAQITD